MLFIGTLLVTLSPRLEPVLAVVEPKLAGIAPAAGMERAVLCQHDRAAGAERSRHRAGRRQRRAGASSAGDAGSNCALSAVSALLSRGLRRWRPSMLRVAAAPHSLAPTPQRAACHAPARGAASRCAAQTLCRPPCRRSRCGAAACEEEPSISLDRGMAGGATAGREVGCVMGRVGAFDGPAAQSPTSPNVL